MRTILMACLLVLGTGFASAQQSPLGSGIGGGIGSGLNSGLGGGISSGLTSGLGTQSPRTMADAFNPERPMGGGSCAPGQADPDRTGCRPVEWLRGEMPNANRVVTYIGDSAFRASETLDPNRVIGVSPR